MFTKMTMRIPSITDIKWQSTKRDKVRPDTPVSPQCVPPSRLSLPRPAPPLPPSVLAPLARASTESARRPPPSSSTRDERAANRSSIDAYPCVQLKDWTFAPLAPPGKSVQFSPSYRPNGLGFRVVGTLVKDDKLTDRGEVPFYSTEIQKVDNNREVFSVNATVYRLEGAACGRRADIPFVSNELKRTMEPFFHLKWPVNAATLFQQVSQYFSRVVPPSPISPVLIPRAATPRTRKRSVASARGTAYECVEGTLPHHASDMSPSYPQVHLTPRRRIT